MISNKTKIKTKRKVRRTANRPTNRGMRLYSQPFVPTVHEIVITYNFNDTAPICLDAFATLGGSTEFSGLATIYALWKFYVFEVELIPFFPYSSVLTDQCRGIAGFAHGNYNINTLPVANIQRLPGAWDYNNKQRFKKRTYFEEHNWIPTNFIDSTTALIPHCQFQANHYTLATTNTQLSLLKVRHLVHFSGRIV